MDLEFVYFVYCTITGQLGNGWLISTIPNITSIIVSIGPPWVGCRHVALTVVVTTSHSQSCHCVCIVVADVGCIHFLLAANRLWDSRIFAGLPQKPRIGCYARDTEPFMSQYFKNQSFYGYGILDEFYMEGDAEGQNLYNDHIVI